MKLLVACVFPLLAGCASAQPVPECAPRHVSGESDSPLVTQLNPADKDADVRRLLKASHSDELAVAMFDQMISMFKTQVPGIPDEFWKNLKTEFDVNQLMDIMVPVYSQDMSQAAVVSATKFLESPSGKEYVAASKKVSMDSGVVAQKWASIIMAQIVEKMQNAGYSQERAKQ
jgi:uncharacterized protein